MLNDTTHAAVKDLASKYKVAIPEIVSRFVDHVLASDNAEEVIADLLSDAPKSQRGRKALSEQEKAARKLRKAAEQAKAAGMTVETLASMLAAEGVYKAKA